MESSTSFLVTVETMTTFMSLTDDDFQPHHGLILACVYLIIAVVCLTCNLLVSCVVCVDKALRVRPQPLLILNMAVLDLIKGLLLIIFTIPTCLSGGAVYPRLAYLIYTCVHTMWRFQSIINITILSICRYIIVCRRHCRPLKKDSRRMTIFAMVMSLFLMLSGAVLHTWNNTFIPDITFTMATVQHIGNGTMSAFDVATQNAYLVMFLFVLPLAMSAFSFIQVAREFHNHPHGRAQLNGINYQRFRREKDVTKMCAVMVGLRFLSETIAILAAMMEIFTVVLSNDVKIVMSVSRDCTCALNPLVYIIGNYRCRANMRRMFARICHSFRSKKVAPQAVFQLERRMSLIQGSQGGRALQRASMSVPDIFQVNRHASTLDGYPILVVEFDNNPTVTGDQPNCHNMMRDDSGDEADDNLDARSNLVPESLLGSVSVMSGASSSFSCCPSPSKDNVIDDSLPNSSKWQKQSSKSSELAQKRVETVGHGCASQKARAGNLTGVDGISSDPADPDDLQNVLNRLPWYSYNHKAESDLQSDANVDGKKLD